MRLVQSLDGAGQNSPGSVTMQEVRATVAANLKRLREALKLTQGQLGARVGMSALMVSHFERGRRTPCAWNLVRLCRALGAPADVVLGMTGGAT